MHCICKYLCQREEFKKEFNTTRVNRDSFKLGYSGVESVNTISKVLLIALVVEHV
jgi:hypothetical protein